MTRKVIFLVLSFIYNLQLAVSESTAVYKAIKVSSSYLPKNSSDLYKSAIECVAATKAGKLPINALKYSTNKNLCEYFVLTYTTIQEALSNPAIDGHTFYTLRNCLPQYCSGEESGFPSDILYYIPLTSDAPSVPIEASYYQGNSASESYRISMNEAWNVSFLDGKYPLWYSDSHTEGYTFKNVPGKVFSSFSMFAWIYINNPNHNVWTFPVLSIIRESLISSGLTLAVGSEDYNERISFRLINSDIGTYYMSSLKQVIRREKWQHVGVTYDGPKGEVELYYNGNAIEKGAFAIPAAQQTHELNQIIIMARQLSANTQWLCKECASIYHEVYDREGSYSSHHILYTNI